MACQKIKRHNTFVRKMNAIGCKRGKYLCDIEGCTQVAVEMVGDKALCSYHYTHIRKG